MAEWPGASVSPAICRLRVRFPSPPGHATLPTTGASANVIWLNVWLWRPTLQIGENGGSTAVWKTPPTQMPEKNCSTYWNQLMFSGSTTSSDTNLESEIECASLILSKINPLLFYHVSICVLWHIWELQRIWIGLKSTEKCRLTRSSYIRETLSIFTLAVFPTRLYTVSNKFSENWQHSDSTDHFSSITAHVMKSMTIWRSWPWPGSNC